jgi:hypothetical protein
MARNGFSEIKEVLIVGCVIIAALPVLIAVVYSVFVVFFEPVPQGDVEESDLGRPLTGSDLAGASPCARERLDQLLRTGPLKPLLAADLRVAEDAQLASRRCSSRRSALR